MTDNIKGSEKDLISMSENYAETFQQPAVQSLGQMNKVCVFAFSHARLLEGTLLTLSMSISTKTVDLSEDAPPCRLIGLFFTLQACTVLLWYLLSSELSGMLKSLMG